MDPVNERRSDCPISLSLELFGDRWTLLVIRDLMFKNRREFREFLGAEEGIASNVLADRLRRLTDAGIVTKTQHPGDARRSIYRLTQKGVELAPILIEIVLWAARHERTAAPAEELAQLRDNPAQVIESIRRAHVGEPETPV